jgi:hypothetical protein
MRTFLTSNTSTSLQTKLAADAHLAEGQFLHEEQALIIQLFIIYALSQQLQGQLQTQHSADIHNYILDTQNIKLRVNCRST